MLTYTFSAREKMMLAILAFVGVVIAWYQFVFVNYQNQMNSLNAQIATVQDEILVNQSRTEALRKMRDEVDTYKQQGIDPLFLPSFDNTKNLMAYLNGVLASSAGYSMSFDNPTVSEENATEVHRTGNITYSADSYESARSIADAIARGPYPCRVTALAITDASSQGKKSKKDDGVVTASLQVTFVEEAPNGKTVATKDEAPQGQDLSKLSDWDK